MAGKRRIVALMRRCLSKRGRQRLLHSPQASYIAHLCAAGQHRSDLVGAEVINVEEMVTDCRWRDTLARVAFGNHGQRSSDLGRRSATAAT